MSFRRVGMQTTFSVTVTADPWHDAEETRLGGRDNKKNRSPTGLVRSCARRQFMKILDRTRTQRPSITVDNPNTYLCPLSPV